MKDIIGFFLTTVVAFLLIIYAGKKRKKSSRYERTPHAVSDWQKLDRGIDPTE